MRLNRIFVGSFFVGVAALYWVCRNAYFVGFFNDDAFYLIGARSLLLGKYVALNEPTEPMLGYMPGYSMLLAPISFFARSWFLPHQIFSILLSMLSLVAYRFFLNKKMPAATINAALIIAALNPLAVSLSGTILSDVPYLLFSMIIVLCSERAWNAEKNVVADWFVLFVLCVYAAMLRPSGAAWGIAVAVALAIDKKWTRFAAFSVAYVVMVFAIAWPEIRRYLFELGSADTLHRVSSAPAEYVVRNIRFYLHELFVHNLIRSGNPIFQFSTIVVCFALMVTGAWRYGVNGQRKVLLIYLALYALIQLAWPKQSGRYVYAVFPFVVFFISLGLVRTDRTKTSALVSMFLGLTLFCIVPPIRAIVRSSVSRDTPLSSPPSEMLEWISRNTARTDIFAAELDGAFYIQTDRKTYHLPKIFHTDEFFRWCEQRAVKYVVFDSRDFIMRTPGGNTVHDPFPNEELARILSTPDAFKEVFHSSQGEQRIYRVNILKASLDTGTFTT